MTHRAIFSSTARAFAVGLALVAGCAGVSPSRELVDARAAYQRAIASAGAGLVPAELHKAKTALDIAELAYLEQPDATSTPDLAYVADRKARRAEALGATELARREKEEAATAIQQAQERSARLTQGELAKTREQLAAEKREVGQRQAALDRTREQLAVEKREAAARQVALNDTSEQLKAEELARRDAEHKADQALKDLAAVNALKEDERGMVITVPGSVLFASGQWTLLSSAQLRLNQVADALLGRRENIVVEGHTDDRGSDGLNQELSDKRAGAVRDYLVSRGLPAEHFRSIGFGKTRPVADNRSAEGRANNRRVEIVVEQAKTTERSTIHY